MPWLTEMKSQSDPSSTYSVLNFNRDETEPSIIDYPVYRLNLSKLNKEKIYLIFPQGHDSTFKVINWLRDVVFLDNKDQYTMEEKVINEINFYAFSTDRKNMDICKRTADIFNLIFKNNTSQTAILNKKEHFIPSSEQIFVIRSKKASENNKFTSEEDRCVKSFGKSFSYSTLD